MHSVSLRTCVWIPPPVPKSLVRLMGGQKQTGGGVPHAHAHTYKLINVKQDKSHVEQIRASKHISSLGGRERVVR